MTSSVNIRTCSNLYLRIFTEHFRISTIYLSPSIFTEVLPFFFLQCSDLGNEKSLNAFDTIVYPFYLVIYNLFAINGDQNCFYVIYWVTQKLPQICTVILCIRNGNVAWFAVYICDYFLVTQYLPIRIHKITVQICGNFWVTKYVCRRIILVVKVILGLY